jgi:4-amino-4-deoxy-L-arabinose transferase-like glycosyltransferase
VSILLRVLARFGRIILVAACLYCLLFQGIGSVGFLSTDEPRYAAIGQEMAHSGDWLTPRLWGSVWLEKPPLLFWMTATAWKLGLRDEWAARLPLALISLGFLVFFQGWVAREFDSAAGWRAAMMLATSVGWIAYSTVATLTKGFLPLILALPILWFWRTRWRALIQPGLIAVAVALPWYAACYSINGWPMIEELFLRQQLGRFFTNERQHVQPIWFYIPVLLGLLVPWTPALASLRASYQSDRTKYFLVTAAFGLLFFSLSTNKLPGYVLPLLPALCIAMGMQELRGWPLRLCGALAAIIPLAAAVLPRALVVGLTRAGGPNLQLVAIAVIMTTGLTVIAEARWRRGFVMVALLVAGGIGFAKIPIYRRLDQNTSARGRWRSIAAHASDVCLDGASRDLAYGLAYYNGGLLPDCTTSPKAVRIGK